jgi:hypothetical protein
MRHTNALGVQVSYHIRALFHHRKTDGTIITPSGTGRDQKRLEKVTGVSLSEVLRTDMLRHVGKATESAIAPPGTTSKTLDGLGLG